MKYTRLFSIIGLLVGMGFLTLMNLIHVIKVFRSIEGEGDETQHVHS